MRMRRDLSPITDDHMGDMAHALGLNHYEEFYPGDIQATRNHYCGPMPDSLVQRNLIIEVKSPIPTVDYIWKVTPAGRDMVMEWLPLSRADRREYLRRINGETDARDYSKDST